MSHLLFASYRLGVILVELLSFIILLVGIFYQASSSLHHFVETVV